MDDRWIWIATAGVTALLVLGLGAWFVARTQDSETRSLIARIGRLSWRDKLRLARALLSDRRIPLWLRGLAPALALYLIMPIDLIPDFIPVVGYLDDLVVALVAGGLLLRFAPRSILEDHLARLEVRTDG